MFPLPRPDYAKLTFQVMLAFSTGLMIAALL
jgi:hypothetical protein